MLPLLTVFSFPYMDIYPTSAVDGSRVKTFNGPCTFEKEWIWPIKKISMYNSEFPVPARAETILGHVYGSVWRIEAPSYHGESFECNEKKISFFKRILSKLGLSA